MMLSFALPPPDFPMPAYVRRAESGLLVPIAAVLPGLMMPPGLLSRTLGPVAISFVVNDADGTNASSYTFSGVSIGTASADRVVVVGASGYGNAPSGLTIGGVAATQLVLAKTGSRVGWAGLWALSVPTGSTADIVVTIGGSADRCGIAVWTVTGTGGSAAAYLTSKDEDGGTSGDLTIGVKKDGGVIAYAYSASAPAFSWGGVTKQFEHAIETADREQSGGAALTASDNAAYSITFTASGGTDTAGCAVSFAPG